MTAAILPLGLSPSGNGLVAAIFPPWWDPARIARAAARSGLIVGVGRFAFVVILARPPGADALPWPRGAWLLLDSSLIGGCSTAPLAVARHAA